MRIGHVSPHSPPLVARIAARARRRHLHHFPAKNNKFGIGHKQTNLLFTAANYSKKQTKLLLNLENNADVDYYHYPIHLTFRLIPVIAVKGNRALKPSINYTFTIHFGPMYSKQCTG